MLITAQKLRLNSVLAALILFVITINLPYLSNDFMVGHDTKNVYATFHYFYNHLTWYHELPRWLPFGEYGYQTLFYQISNLSPSTYLVGLIGWLVGADNTLLLFKYSVIVEQLVLLLGFYLLTTRLYKDLWTTFIVSLLGAGSIIWYWQIYWDLRLFYLIPLVLYFYWRFIEEQQTWCFWSALITLQFGLVGGLAYWAPVYAFVFLLMAAILLPDSTKAYRKLLRPGWRDFLLMLVFFCCSASLLYVLATCLTGIHNYSSGRATNEMRTQLSSYLTYASTPIWDVLHAFLDGMRPNTNYYQDMTAPLRQLPDRHYPDDIHLYIGLFPLAGIAAYLFSARNRWFYSLGGGALALIALAGTGAFSLLLYWVMPGMNMFRHLSLLLELGKILLLLAGGFGIQFLLARISDRQWLTKRYRPFHLALLLITLFLIFDLVVSITVHKSGSWNSPTELATLLPTGGWLILCRLATWAIVVIGLFAATRIPLIAPRNHAVAVKSLLVAACLVDALSFQGYNWAQRTNGQYAGLLPLEPMRFAEQRASLPTEDATQKDAVLQASPYGAYHAYYCNIMLYDPCTPYGFVDIFPEGVHKLVTARGAAPTQESIQNMIPPNDRQLMQVMGCNAPKLRLVSRAAFGQSDLELANLISANPELDQVAVLRGAPFQAATQPWIDPNPMTTVVRSFNANRLDVEIDVKPGRAGWLIYADSYNPHWKAFINDQETPMREAYLAFKAIAVPEGRTVVSFRLENSRQMLAMGWLMVTGICFAICSLLGLGFFLVSKPTA